LRDHVGGKERKQIEAEPVQEFGDGAIGSGDNPQAQAVCM
jgi:hypothetical protein